MNNICKILILLQIILMTTGVKYLFSQGAAINTTGANPDPSAMLDITSTNAGILIPRMTEAQKNLIPAPATGLMVYQTDGVSGFWYYNGSTWVQSTGPAGIAGTTGPTGNTGATGLLISGSLAGNTPYWDGSQWVVNSSNIYNNGGAVGIGTSSPDASAVIDIASISKGALIPRMSTTQRNNISNPAQGLLIINTTTNCMEIYFSPIWQSVYCGCSLPSAPAAGTHTPSTTSILWNWNAVSGATGYKYNTINDYSSATDNGANTSYNQGGLTCNTGYNLYVWSYNSCGGSSSSTTLSQTTSTCPFVCGSSSVTFTYYGSSVTYGTVVGQNSTCWFDRNLGATSLATAYNDVNAYGDLFQWGRGADGHQLRSNNSTTATLSTSDVPGHSYFIVNSNSPYDWRNPQNTNLWQGVSGVNKPCPAGWRVPVSSELDNERASWSSPQGYNQAYASSLKWVAGGQRGNTGSLGIEGMYGRYWSSSYSGSYSNGLSFYDSGSAMYTTWGRNMGISVRCIKD